MNEPTIAVFGASRAEPGDARYEEGRRLGRLLAEAGFAVATGGYAGLMEAVCRGACEVGGHAIGYTAPAVFPHRESANPYIQVELAANSIGERVRRLIEETDASIALSGSIGTFTELMAAWNVAFVAQFSGISPKPVIAVGPLWRSLVDDLIDKLDTPDHYVDCVDTVEDAVALLQKRLRD
jgi:uncharacterized protein (TIGR00730 family)